MAGRGRPPNIVLVLTDDQGLGDLGCTGNPVIETPNLGAFHDQALRFTDFHVGPTCAPTRAMLFCGHYANSAGVWHTVGGRSLLRGNETTIADVFAENGYVTGLFGKWHLGDNHPYRPHERGFMETITHGGGGISQMPDYWLNDYFDDTYLVNGQPRRFEGYCTDVWFREAMSFIERHRREPFLCCITPNVPHYPYNVEPRYSDRYRGRAGNHQRERFYGMITNIDENCGRLLALLDRLQLAGNTIVIFMTDNGTSAGFTPDQRQLPRDGFNAGLRGGKGSAYDGGHRVPLFIRWPRGGLLPPRDIDTLASAVDFMPTMMDLAGLDLRRYAHLRLHGMSLKALLTEEEQPACPERVITTDSQRLPLPVKWRQSAVMTREWRLVNGGELYDARRDRAQQHDVAGRHPEVVRRLRAEYERWWELVNAGSDAEVPISIGAARGVTSCLRAHDWRPLARPWPTAPDAAEDNAYLVYSQQGVRAGLGRDGYFELMVEQGGRYRLEPRRWPLEADLPIRVGIAPSTAGWRSDIILEERDHYCGGRALLFDRARLRIGEREWEAPVTASDRGVAFEVRLQRGPAHLQCTFAGGGIQRGAYYVYARRL